MRVKVNCKFINQWGDCNKKERFLKLFKRSCPLLWEPFGRCELQEQYPKPKLGPPPKMSGGPNKFNLSEEEQEVIRVMRKDW